MTDKNVLGIAAYVLISTYREKALKVLVEHDVMTPKYIAKHCGIRQNHISFTLKELKEHGLVVCLNPEVRKGRLYQITSLGREVYNQLPLLKGEVE